MNNFDTLFFQEHTAPSEKIKHIFHRHILVMLEDILVWLFFGIVVPAIVYYLDIFSLSSTIPVIWVYVYMFVIYFFVIYRLFDWYLDVWIATDETLIDVRWKWFVPQLLYIPYDKIEGIEVRTRSAIYSLLGISDVVVKLMGTEEYELSSASNPKKIVSFLQEAIKPHRQDATFDGDKESFDVLVNTLSDVVRWHLSTKGKTYITKDYVKKLDHTLTHGVPIDLRWEDEKTIVNKWKQRHKETPQEAPKEERKSEEK